MAEQRTDLVEAAVAPVPIATTTIPVAPAHVELEADVRYPRRG